MEGVGRRDWGCSPQLHFDTQKRRYNTHELCITYGLEPHLTFIKFIQHWYSDLCDRLISTSIPNRSYTTRLTPPPTRCRPYIYPIRTSTYLIPIQYLPNRGLSYIIMLSIIIYIYLSSSSSVIFIRLSSCILIVFCHHPQSLIVIASYLYHLSSIIIAFRLPPPSAIIFLDPLWFILSPPGPHTGTARDLCNDIKQICDSRRPWSRRPGGGGGWRGY